MPWVMLFVTCCVNIAFFKHQTHFRHIVCSFRWFLQMPLCLSCCITGKCELSHRLLFQWHSVNGRGGGTFSLVLLPSALNSETGYIESLLLQCSCWNGFRLYFGGSENEKKRTVLWSWSLGEKWKIKVNCFTVVITSSVINICMLL